MPAEADHLDRTTVTFRADLRLREQLGDVFGIGGIYTAVADAAPDSHGLLVPWTALARPSQIESKATHLRSGILAMLRQLSMLTSRL